MVGGFGMIGFSSIWFEENRLISTQNSLNLFPGTYILAFIARIALFFQVFSIFPLLFYIMRMQFSLLLYETKELSQKASLIFNIVLLTITTLIGGGYPKLGNILSFVGSFLGLFLIYILPISVYLK